MTTEELKAVLDLPEEEQNSFLRNYAYNHLAIGDYWHNFLNKHISLADLAFRMRDEARKATEWQGEDGRWWGEAIGFVYKVATKYPVEVLVDNEEYVWLSHFAKPIHWIFAAIKAKELSKEKENGKNT